MMRRAPVSPATKSGLCLILFFQIAVVICVFTMPRLPSILLSAAMIAFNTAMMITICRSLTSRGVGEDRTSFDVISVSIFGLIALPVYFSIFYRWFGVIKTSTSSNVDGYLECIYFSFVTWTTLGYGDYVPSQESQIIVIVEVIIGYSVMSLFIASLVVAIQRAGDSKTRNT